MEVICKGYKTCEHNTWCHHSKPHKYDEVSELYCLDKDDIVNDDNCCCDKKLVRKYKLEKLNRNAQ